MSKDVRNILKAMDTATATEGLEFVPEELSSQLLEKIRLERRVEALFQSISMPTNPYIFPVEGADATAYLVAESTADDATTTPVASTPGTTNVTLTAKKLKAKVFFSEEIQQDSIIDIANYVQGKIARAIVDATEDAIINGDTAGTQDTGFAGTDAKLAWNGLRKLALANAETKKDMSTFDITTFRALIAQMGEYGVNPSDVALVVGVKLRAKLLSMADASGNLILTTVDKFGPNATITNGVIGSIDGMDVIVSKYMKETQSATGVSDGATTSTKGSIIAFHKPSFLIGMRQGLTIKSFEYITTGQTVVVSGVRKAFAPIFTVGATNPTVVVGYNITL